MPRRNLKDRNIRKIFKSSRSYVITLPIEVVKNLGWKEKQKIIIRQRGKKIIIEDWKK